MNIFFVEVDPFKAAQSLVDKHVVKMVLETAQLLSTAHRVLDGTRISVRMNNRNRSRWILPDARDTELYAATHVNHPSAVWVRQSNKNYMWLYDHFLHLINEYNHRYGKTHKCITMGTALFYIPDNIPINVFTEPPAAMDKQYVISTDAVTNYRNYYIHGKKHLHKWTNRQPPEWINS